MMLRVKDRFNRLSKMLSSLFLLIVVIPLISACQHTSSRESSRNASWQLEILNYKNTLSASHPDSSASILHLPFNVRQQITQLFNDTSNKHTKAEKLANWLIAEDGHYMRYDINANLNPADAFAQKRGNCLSFTILFSSLASELGIDVEFNLVDIPDIWGADNNNSLILYRHINSVLDFNGSRNIFDLAIDLYDFRYPQKIISRDDALAQLHSNRAITEMNTGDYGRASHLLKLAVSLSPNNEDLWVNLGVVSNRLGDTELAERSYLHAYSINYKNVVTASSLERFYTAYNQPKKAEKYQKAAQRARESNPYYHYENAKENYAKEDYKKALSQIKKAIGLHSQDSRFYELSSRISQKLDRYDLALKDVLIAYQLSREVNDQNRFADKAKLISSLVPERQLQRILNQ